MILRTFVAVVPPDDVLEAMTVFVSKLRPLAPYRWVSRAQLHLTLRFLGEAGQERVEAMADALEKLDAGESFELRLDRTGAFPPGAAKPRVIWLGCGAGGEKLTALAVKVEQAAINSGFAPEAKKFTPHLTLARARGEEPMPPALASALKSTPSFAWNVSRFHLVKSDLTSGKPVYSLLREYKLS